jgi:hypothetical protein
MVAERVGAMSAINGGFSGFGHTRIVIQNGARSRT